MLNEKSIDDSNLEKVSGGVSVEDGPVVIADSDIKHSDAAVYKRTEF